MTKLGRFSKSIHKLFSTKYVTVTNMVVGSTLFVGADLIEQTLELQRRVANKYDLRRAGRMAAMGLLSGPMHQVLFGILEKFYPGRSKGATWRKVVIDQVVSGPTFNLNFFMGMGIMEGKSVQDAWEEFLRKIPTVFLTELIVWIPCQYINFFYVPLQYRVIFVNSVTFFWNIYLSYIKHYDQHESPRVKTDCRRGDCACHKNKSSLVLTKLVAKLLPPTKKQDDSKAE